MKTILHIGIVAGLIFTGSIVFGKTSGDLTGLEEDTRALIAKERARQMMFKSQGENLQNQSDQASSNKINDPTANKNGPTGLESKRAIVKSGGVTGGCNMDIGNSEGGPGTGLNKPKPVIITGPVIQLCK